MKWGITISLFVLAIAGSFTYWFLQNFEKRTEEVYVGYHDKARSNPLLAAEQFLNHNGVEAESFSTIVNLEKLPANNDVLLIPTQRFDIGPKRVKEIMDWIRTGGHLIVVGRIHTGKSDEESDPILQPQGIRTYRRLLEIGEDKHDIPLDITLKTNDEVRQVFFDPDNWLESEKDQDFTWHVEGEQGAQLIEFTLGRGRLTVMSDFGFMRNSEIGKNDHAAFLWHLVHISANRGKVWIIYNDDMPPLWDLIIEKAWAVVMVAAMLLAAWLWAASRRFGPLVPNPLPIRRNLLEHIQACGQFLWRHKYSYKLLQSVRNALYKNISDSHPGWLKLEEEKLHKRLAVLGRLPVEDVRLALQTEQTENDHEFTRLVSTLEIIRKKL